MKAVQTRIGRLYEALPVLAGMGVYAVAHGRALVVVPLILALLVAIVRRLELTFDQNRVSAISAGGAAMGFALALVFPPPQGPIPPALLGPMCGVLLALASYCVIARSPLYAWIYSLLLVVLSVNAPLSSWLFVSLGELAFVVLFATYQAQRAGRPIRLAGLAGFLVFALLTTGATLGLTRMVFASEGLLMGAVYDILKDAGFPMGLGLQQIVSLRSRSTVTLSQKVLMDLDGAPPERLRTVVLDQFDGTHWTTSKALAEQRPALDAAPTAPRTLELMFIENLGRVVPAPAGTVSIERGQALGGFVFDGGDLRGKRVSLSRGDERLPQEGVPDDSLTALPEELRAELAPLAAGLLPEGRTPRQKAELLVKFFQDKFEYSLTTNLMGKGHPLAVLIRERRPAYCIYFASALASLLRASGVPARLVGGFVPSETNRVTGRTLVRERDAHAWVEVYLPEERRFVAFDPTPWRSREDALGIEQPGIFGALVDAAGSALRRLFTRVRMNPGEVISDFLLSPFTLIAIGLTLLVVIVRRIRNAPKKVPVHKAAALVSDPRLGALYASYLAALRKTAGLDIDAAATDDEILLRLGAQRGEVVARVAQRFIDGYREARFREAKESDVGSLQAAMGALEEALRRPSDAKTDRAPPA